MAKYSEFDSMVAEFFSEWGFQATYVKTTTTPNDATGGVSSTSVEIPINAIRSELLRPLNGTGTATQTTIQDGDLMLYVQPTEKASAISAPLVIDPSSDAVIINGITWNVITVKAVAPDPTDVVLYELYIRK